MQLTLGLYEDEQLSYNANVRVEENVDVVCGNEVMSPNQVRLFDLDFLTD